MPTLNIKNQHVYELAKTLSERTGRSMTSVIEAALERQLELLERRASREREERMAQLNALIATTAPILAHLPTDAFADLYDEETGLPR